MAPLFFCNDIFPDVLAIGSISKINSTDLRGRYPGCLIDVKTPICPDYPEFFKQHIIAIRCPYVTDILKGLI